MKKEKKDFQITKGTAVDKNAFLVLAKVGISIDNKQTLSALLSEILTIACDEGVMNDQNKCVPLQKIKNKSNHF